VSDSESYPLRGRLKGILGSFKKKKSDKPATLKHSNCPRNNSSPYNCLRDQVSVKSTMKTNEEVAAGIISLATSSNSSPSYHTPGSPPKQQSESGSSLSRLQFMCLISFS